MTNKEVMQMAMDIMESAIKAGDWVVDGACDPDWVLNALRAALAQPENDFNPDWDAMAVMVEEQQRMAKRIEELEARLAQPEQEPVGINKVIIDSIRDSSEIVAPPKREWVGLTDEEARELCVANVPYVIDMVRALEAKLKEKNT